MRQGNIIVASHLGVPESGGGVHCIVEEFIVTQHIPETNLSYLGGAFLDV